jgi:hypothetical protein
MMKHEKPKAKTPLMSKIINDRGIHICKSMIAWQKFGNDETPQSTEIIGRLPRKIFLAFCRATSKNKISSPSTQGESVRQSQMAWKYKTPFLGGELFHRRPTTKPCNCIGNSTSTHKVFKSMVFAQLHQRKVWLETFINFHLAFRLDFSNHNITTSHGIDFFVDE